MSDYIAYYNGEWMPYDEVKVHPQDRGFTLGDVVFENQGIYGDGVNVAAFGLGQQPRSNGEIFVVSLGQPLTIAVGRIRSPSNVLCRRHWGHVYRLFPDYLNHNFPRTRVV